MSFLIIYYTVLVVREPNGIGIFEALMYLWIVAFAYDQLSGMVDTGMLFYQMDFWSVWNIGIIGTGFAFVIASESFFKCALWITSSLAGAPGVNRLTRYTIPH